MQIKRQYLIPAFLCLLAGGFILVYRGPMWKLLRYYGGDVVVVAFLYFIVSLFWHKPAIIRATVIAIFAFLIEIAQLLRLTPQDSSLLTAIIFGSSFDIWDLFAYILGLILAVIIDISWLNNRQKLL